MIKLTDLYAQPGHAPIGFQVPAPTHAYGQGSAYKPPVKPSPDLTRVLALKRRAQVEIGSPRGHALVRMMTARFAVPRTTPCRCRLPRAQGGITQNGTDCILTLNLVQALALYEIGIVQGLLGPIGVGHGKTILDILAILALIPPDHPEPRKYEAVLLVPPGLVGQLIDEYFLIGEHFRIPSLAVHGRDIGWDAGADRPVLHVLPYSRLQRPEATVLLKKIRPAAIIADEVHSLRNRDAVRTHRVLSYFNEFRDTRFCGWTGSITDSSIADYAHLSALALRYNSPLPIDKEVVKEWASALDPKSDWPADPGALLDGLVETKCMSPGEHIHKGFHRRLIETEGVVATKSAAIAAELRVTQRAAPRMPSELETMLETLRETKTRPDGEVLLEQLDVSRCARELAAGFYYRFIYPHATDEELEDGGLVDQWFAARKLFRWELREQLSPERRREHMDSPFLCTLAAMRYHGDIRAGIVEVEEVDEETGDLVLRQVDTTHLPQWASKYWPGWRDIKDKVKKETEAVWVSEFLAEDAAQWAHENRGIVWYDKTAFGLKVAEISKLPLHGGGPGAEDAILAEQGDRSIIASIKSHGTGRNGLQKIFCTQLIANPPSSATAWEQLLGRLHRIGQAAPAVYAEFYCHTEEMWASYGQACERARYIQNTIGAAQKLNPDDED